MSPKASICIATHNKRDTLYKVLDSIFKQTVPFAFEVVVCDDGGSDGTRDVTNEFRLDYDLTYLRTETSTYRNPSFARNQTMRYASGEVLILQSDDVVHHTPNTVEKLVNELYPNTYNIATVNNQYADGTVGDPYTGLENRRPYFFLGSVLREHAYAVGGNDEEFAEPGYDDNWFACCLHRGLGLEVNYRPDIVGYHQDHPRPAPVSDRMHDLFWHKYNAAERGAHHWMAAAGPWEFTLNEG